MSGRVRYHPLFDCDAREAAVWYDRRSRGLGDAFIDVVRSTASKVIAEPNRSSCFAANLRYARVARFPYVVVFDVRPDELRLLGVMHTAQSMEKWRERVNDD